MVLVVVRLKTSKRFHVTHSAVLALLAKGWLCGLKGKLESVWKRNLLRLNKYAETSFVLSQEVPDLKKFESRRVEGGELYILFYSFSYSSPGFYFWSMLEHGYCARLIFALTQLCLLLCS